MVEAPAVIVGIAIIAIELVVLAALVLGSVAHSAILWAKIIEGDRS